MTKGLLECPFCGSKLVDKHIATQFDETGIYVVTRKYSVVCGNCGCRTAIYNEWVNAENAWNRRAYE